MSESTKNFLIWASFIFSGIQALGVALFFFNIRWSTVAATWKGNMSIAVQTLQIPKFLVSGCLVSAGIGFSILLYSTHRTLLAGILAAVLVLLTAAWWPKEDESSIQVYAEDFQCGVRAYWLDRTFLFVNCRMVSPLKTTSIVRIEPSITTSDGKQWGGEIMEKLSDWYLTHDVGSDQELEELSLWAKLRESPLHREVQITGWLGVVINTLMTKEELASIRKLDLQIEDGGRKKHKTSLSVSDKLGRMIVAKHLRHPH